MREARSGGAEGPQRRPPLDGLRAVALLPVVAVHADRSHFPGGSVGVDVFFVLSAFLITSLILEEVKQRNGRFSFFGFYVRRVLRLGPALLMWLVLLAAPTAVLTGHGHEVWTSSLFSMLYVGNYAIVFDWPLDNVYRHVWSLGVEEQFYLLWPPFLVGVLLRRRLMRAARHLPVVIAAAVVLQLATTMIWNDNYYLPSGHIVALAAGAASAFVFRRGTTPLLMRVLTMRALPLLVLGGLVVMTLAPDSRWLPFTLVVGSLGAAALVLHICMLESGAAARLLSLRPLVWLGTRSYGMYLYHRTIALLVPQLAPGIRLTYAAPIALAVSLLLSELSFRLVERPVQRAGKAWLRTRGTALRSA